MATAAVVLALALGVAGKGDLAFDAIAKDWLERNQLAAEPTAGLALADVLERAFARIELGGVRVYLPPSALADARTLDDVRTSLLSVIAAQTTWEQWRTGEERDGKKGALLERWIRSWTPKALGAAPLSGVDLVERLAPDDDVRGALAELALGGDAPLTGDGARPEPAVSPVLVLLPQRAEFVELVCVAGWIDPVLRPSAWSEGVATWLEYDADGTRLLTLQYTASANGNWRAGVGVGERNPAALAELVTQVTARILLRRAVSDLDPALVSALANALVIDLHGELDTRIDGDVRGRSSEARSVFVPGGNPDGGTLPPASAENRWRETKGKDHFVGILSQVQKKGGKKGSGKAGKLGAFELESDGGAQKGVVTAPFLGAGGKKPDAALWADYIELVRCYGVAFVHWLREEGAGTGSESRAAFAELVAGLAQGASPERLPALFQEVYGEPLSAADAAGLFASPTLEGRFLTWLSKQR